MCSCITAELCRTDWFCCVSFLKLHNSVGLLASNNHLINGVCVCTCDRPANVLVDIPGSLLNFAAVKTFSQHSGESRRICYN